MMKSTPATQASIAASSAYAWLLELEDQRQRPTLKQIREQIERMRGFYPELGQIRFELDPV